MHASSIDPILLRLESLIDLTFATEELLQLSSIETKIRKLIIYIQLHLHRVLSIAAPKKPGK